MTGWFWSRRLLPLWGLASKPNYIFDQAQGTALDLVSTETLLRVTGIRILEAERGIFTYWRTIQQDDEISPAAQSTSTEADWSSPTFRLLYWYQNHSRPITVHVYPIILWIWQGSLNLGKIDRNPAADVNWALSAGCRYPNPGRWDSHWFYPPTTWNGSTWTIPLAKFAAYDKSRLILWHCSLKCRPTGSSNFGFFVRKSRDFYYRLDFRWNRRRSYVFSRYFYCLLL